MYVAWIVNFDSAVTPLLDDAFCFRSAVAFASLLGFILAATDEVDQRVEREANLGPTWSAFAKLTANEQTILMLCVIEELPQEEVARTLGLTVGTVKSRLSRLGWIDKTEVCA